MQQQSGVTTVGEKYMSREGEKMILVVQVFQRHRGCGTC